MPIPLRRTDHPFLVDSLEKMPAGIRELAEQAIHPGESAETIFIVPEHMKPGRLGGFGGMHLVPDQALIFTENGVIHVQAGKSAGDLGRSAYLPGSSILYVRMILVLLYAQVEVCGVVNGQLSCIVMQYNAVGQERIEPALKKFLRLAWSQIPGPKPDSYQNFLLSNLQERSHKFRSGLETHSLQSGECLLGYVFQPRVLKNYFRIVYAPLAPASLLAVTDKQLIIIQEGITSATSYGYFITFCPLPNVVSVDTRVSSRLQEVCVHLEKDGHTSDHKLIQENDNALACQDLWASQGIKV